MTTTNDTGTRTEYASEQPARLRWAEHAPEVYEAMVRLDSAAKQGLDPRLVELVRLREVACEFAPEQLVVRSGDREKMRRMFRHWGFKGMLVELDADASGRQAELI